MKKGLGYLLLFAFSITLMLYFVQRNNTFLDTEGNKIIEVINEEKELNLNEFLILYNTGTFERLELVENKNLKGYEFISTKDIGKDVISHKPKKQRTYDVFFTSKPADTSLEELGISFTGNTSIIIDNQEKGILSKLFIESILPILILFILIVVILKFFGPKGGAGGFPFSTQVGKQKTKHDSKNTFKDVAGMEESKEELKEIVDYLKNPKKYEKAGAKIPKGVLLYGSPGSGKTLLARAVAGEASVPFFSASGSEFMEMLVGMGAAKVRELFKKAKMITPSIVFIDEIDSIGKKRGGGMTGGHQEQEQTLNQILTEMDGFEQGTNVIVIAATNRPDMLDPALLRSGRFDRKIMIGRPTLKERLEILELHGKNKKFAKEIDLDTISKRTSGFVGADLANIINEAALNAAKNDREILTNDDMEYALEKVVMGPEKKIKYIKEQERKIIAYHELGHAITAYYLPNADPVEKISIVSRGMALGVTWMVPKEDKYLYSKVKFLDELVTLLGGRAAEEVFFGKDEITTGASNDFEKVTKIAYNMVVKYGMDEELGTMVYMDREKMDYTPFKPFSEKTAEIIDEKVKEIVKTAYNRAINIIETNKDTIDNLADILLKKEYLTKDEFKSIIQNPEKLQEYLSEFKISNEKNNILKKTEKKLKQDSDVEKNKNIEGVLDKFFPSKEEIEKANSKKSRGGFLSGLLKKINFYKL